MKAQTATVEVLTAQVHVLSVGSRQITASVAKQLDFVEPVEIEPFGRIRIGLAPDCMPLGHLKRTSMAYGRIEVIGSRNGVLVRSHITQSQPIRCTQTPCKRHYVKTLVDPRFFGKTYERNGPEHIYRQYSGPARLYTKWSELPLIVLAGLR